MRRKKHNDLEILEILGEGLTSRVYKAIRKHSALDVRQVVALKVLHSEDSIHSLKNEIELLLSVDSPYCVKMLGWEETAKGLALVLEFLDGVSLEELCRFRSLNPEDIDEIVFQIQEGLKELHRKGIVHGDLSPRNIFVTNSGGLKIIDFGFSSREQKRFDYGTPNCMSLEAWRGENVSTGSDLYSLGLLRETLWDSNGDLTAYRNWRARAESVMNKNSLLRETPSDREFLEIRTHPDRRSRIAGYVQEIQRWRNLRQPTMKLSSDTEAESSTSWWFSKKIVSAAVAIFASVSVSAVEPVRFHESDGIYRRLDIRSREWVNARLFKKSKGREVFYQQGYTPVQFHSLPSGDYVLRWTSPSESGMMDVQMRGEDQKILIEAR